jgi:hypothetical protein
MRASGNPEGFVQGVLFMLGGWKERFTLSCYLNGNCRREGIGRPIFYDVRCLSRRVRPAPGFIPSGNGFTPHYRRFVGIGLRPARGARTLDYTK